MRLAGGTGATVVAVGGERLPNTSGPLGLGHRHHCGIGQRTARLELGDLSADLLSVLAVSDAPALAIKTQVPSDSATLRLPRGRRSREILVVTGLVVLGAVTPLVISYVLHMLPLPSNDDWAYRVTVLRFVKTGHLHFVPWGDMTLIGQVLWAAPFVLVLGGGTWAPVISTVVLASAGLVAAYLLARQLLSTGRAAACVLVTLASPGFLLNTATFMTDVPAFSAELICLLSGSYALKNSGRRRYTLLAASMLAGCFAFSIRQFGITAPAAVLLCAALQRRSYLRPTVILGAATLAVCELVYLLAGKFGQQVTQLSSPNLSTVAEVFQLYFTLSFCLLPLLPSVLKRLRPRVGGPVVVAALVIVAGGVLYHTAGMVFRGNYLTVQGAMGNDLQDYSRPDVFAPGTWAIFNVGAIVSGAALAALAAQNLTCLLKRRWEVNSSTLLGAFAVLIGTGVVAYTLCSASRSYDRYLYPLVFPLAAILARSTRGKVTKGAFPAPRRLPYATIALAGLVGLSALALTLNSDAYGSAVWRAGQALVRAGEAPSSVDGGFAWNGWYAEYPMAPVEADGPIRVTPTCGVISSFKFGGHPRAKLVAVTNYDEYGFALPEHLYSYAEPVHGCPAIPG